MSSRHVVVVTLFTAVVFWQAVQIVIGVIVMVKVGAMFFIDVHFQIYSTSYWGFLFVSQSRRLHGRKQRFLSISTLKNNLNYFIFSCVISYSDVHYLDLI